MPNLNVIIKIIDKENSTIDEIMKARFNMKTLDSLMNYLIPIVIHLNEEVALDTETLLNFTQNKYPLSFNGCQLVIEGINEFMQKLDEESARKIFIESMTEERTLQ